MKYVQLAFDFGERLIGARDGSIAALHDAAMYLRNKAQFLDNDLAATYRAVAAELEKM